MQKILIRTAGREGLGVFRLIRENECYRKCVSVVGFVDVDTGKIGGEVAGTPVISLCDAEKKYKNGEINKIIIPCELHSTVYARRHMIHAFVNELLELGFAEDDILISNVLARQSKTKACTSFERDFVMYEKFCHLRYMEFSAAFHCNLNCKGCSHFSPLVKEEFPDLAEMEKDFTRLRELVPVIHVIRILGGEPFLNPEICEYIRLIRKSYPFANLRICTNGMLMKSLPDTVWDTLRKNHVSIDISVYRPLRNMYDDMLKLLKRHEIDSSMRLSFEFAPVFKKSKVSFPFDDTEKTCIYTNLAHGYVSPCMLMHDMKYYNEYFDLHIPHKDGLIYLHDSNLTGPELVKKLNAKYELCDYCDLYKHMSTELGEIYHDTMQISWGMYTNFDQPQRGDWQARR